MAGAELAGENLGQRHKGYNATLQQLISTEASPDVNLGDNDLTNIFKIDLASNNKDAEYILGILKNEDMLYVSRALSQSTWLITDQEFANIINPEYLQSNVFPYMTTKAVIKFTKFIRQNIKDETRAEQFCLNEKNPSDAVKWLPYCSVKFIESEIKNFMQKLGKEMKPRLFRRLSEKSVSIFKIMLETMNEYERPKYLNAVTFIFNANTDIYLDYLENHLSDFGYGGGQINRKGTEILMKHSPERIIDNIEKYVSVLHVPTFVKYLKSDQIKSFLYTQAKKDVGNYELRDIRRLFHFDIMKLFIRRLPKNEQFEFVKDVCMVKSMEDFDATISPSDTETVRVMKLCNPNKYRPYVWYEFAPFEVAFKEITNLFILSEDIDDKRNMICTLVKFANNNWQHIKDVIDFYKKNLKDSISGKGYIATEILQQTCISKYDDKSWSILHDLLVSANVYEPSNIPDLDTSVIHLILIYNALNKQKPSEEIEKEFSFDTLTRYKSTMNQEQQNNIFGYLYDFQLSKIKDPISNEDDFAESISALVHILNLLKDWDKSILEFPFVLNKIREFIKLKKENAWKAGLSQLYGVNKSWRKHMFEESMDLNPSEEVCLNALKHEPQLLTRYAANVDALTSNDKVSLRRVARKLRIYWPHSLAKQWIQNYMNNLNKTSGQKAAVQGLCVMLSQNLVLEILHKYKPVNPKIDWKQIEEHVLNVQRLLAKNMHIARPQPNPDVMLLYAKGDYLQFALPSLLAIFYNLKSSLNKQYIPKLLNAPVSVQKHGIRLAFEKLDRQDLKKIFLECWKLSKNVSIRAMIFKYTFKLLCSEKDDTNAVGLWELLELFMENLTFTEDQATYQLLSEVGKVPLNVRAKFLIKSYEFLQKLIPKVDESKRSQYEWSCSHLAEHSREVMDTINLDFVVGIIQEFIKGDFTKGETKFGRVHYADGIISVMSAYLLCTTDENEQILRYEQVVVPLMETSFKLWYEKRDGQFFMRHHFQHLLTRLSMDLKVYVTEKEKIIPVKLFTLIENELVRSLKVSENYIMLTKWKLTVALARLAEKYSTSEQLWYDECGHEFGNTCLEFLKKDVTEHFPCIYMLFSKCVTEVLDYNDILPTQSKLQFYENILSDKNFIQGYLTAIELSANKRSDNDYKQVHEQIFSHPSVEVKMHYYNRIDKPTI